MTQPLRTAYPLNEFVSLGLGCAMWTCLLAAAPWFALWWAVKRGAPMRAWTAGLAVGAAAGLCSFAWMRIRCPDDERLHLLIWHLLPVLLIAALSTLAGVLWLRFRRVTARVREEGLASYGDCGRFGVWGWNESSRLGRLGERWGAFCLSEGAS